MAEEQKNPVGTDLSELEKILQSEVNAATQAQEKVKAKAHSKVSRISFFEFNLKFGGKYSIGIDKIISEMFKALRSNDAPTRKMARWFVVSLLMLAVVGYLTYKRYIHLENIKNVRSSAFIETEKNIGEFFQKQAEHAKLRQSTLSMGRFTIDLKPEEGAPTPNRSMNLAQIEIYIECENKETRNRVDENLASAQDLINSVLSGVSREDLMSKDGKKHLKKRLIEKLNKWVPTGKVVEVYISNLVIN